MPIGRRIQKALLTHYHILTLFILLLHNVLFSIENMVKSKEAEETLIISNHIKPAFGTYKLKVLTPAVLQEFLNKKTINSFAKNSI